MKQTCRLCLGTRNRVFPLSTSSELLHQIEVTFTIKINFKEEYPKEICLECYKCLIQSCGFRNIIINANKQLEQMLQDRGKVEIMPTKLDFAGDEPSSDESEENFSSCNKDGSTVAEHFFTKSELSSLDEPLIDGNIKNEISLDNPSLKGDYSTSYCDNFLESDICTINCIESQNGLKPNEIKISNTYETVKKLKDKSIKSESFTCDQCNFTCNTKYKLMLHKGRHRTLCNICGKSLTAYNFHQHIKMVHTYNPVNCKLCGKVFKNSVLLCYHNRLHRLGKVKCEICNKLLSRSAFNQHRRRHLLGDSRPEKCSLCDKAFFTKDVLNKHIRSHTGERPYPCDICKKGFSSSNALKTHTRQHTNERPYACEYCGVAFIAKVSLKTHLKSKHNVELK